MKTSKRIDYTAKSYEMDLTNLDRLPEDTGIPLINRLNRELNEQSERLEDIFTEIACENLDDMKKCAFYKELVKAKKKNKKALKLAVTEEDDFDTNNPDYLAILEEVNNNPRD
tara:strand:+ start:1183 stop:1521 length:339 start_codon:yes stop_codon:yes gene_type:complete